MKNGKIQFLKIYFLIYLKRMKFGHAIQQILLGILERIEVGNDIPFARINYVFTRMSKPLFTLL